MNEAERQQIFLQEQLERRQYDTAVEEAVNKAIEQTFKIFGVDIHSAESVKAFQEDLFFARRMRKLSNHATFTIVGTLIVSILGGIGTAVWHFLTLPIPPHK